jgi:Spy/CpxP family protein refolding chaperone
MASDWGAEREALRKLITAPSFDKSKALEMVNAKTTAIERNAPAVLTAMANFLDGLTPEQRAEIAEHMEKRSRHQRGHHRSHHRGHDDEQKGDHDERSFETHDDDKDKS